MNLTQTAIKRGVTFAMLYLIAVGFGLFSLARLNLDLYPKMEFPFLAIITQYTGVSPYDIETVITRPIEEAVASVKNVTKVSSTSTQGLSLVTLEFDWGTDIDQSKIEVRDNLGFIEDASRRPLSAEESFDIQRTRGLVSGALKSLVLIEAEVLRSERMRRINVS